MRARFGVVIVNFNCAPMAFDAALSALADGAISVAIVDNRSTDDSREWLRRAVSGAVAPERCDPAGPRAVRFASVAPAAFRREGEATGRGLNLIAAASNDGFAAGVNIGLRALRAEGACDHYLVLNPDAVIAEGALAAFASRLADSSVGLCGATVLRFDAPHEAQALGGARLDPLTLAGQNLGQGASLDALPGQEEIERSMYYPLGAAIALRDDFIDAAGFLDERYFLYYEEADWARAGAPFYASAWAPGAIVYHRYGASSGSRAVKGAARVMRSPLAEYHMARSRLAFACKWRPLLAPVMLALGAAQAMQRAVRGRRAEARALARGAAPGAARVFIPG